MIMKKTLQWAIDRTKYLSTGTSANPGSGGAGGGAEMIPGTFDRKQQPSSGYASGEESDDNASYVKRTNRTVRRRASMSGGYWPSRQQRQQDDGGVNSSCFDIHAGLTTRRNSMTSTSYAESEGEDSPQSPVPGPAVQRRRASLGAFTSSLSLSLTRQEDSNNTGGKSTTYLPQLFSRGTSQACGSGLSQVSKDTNDSCSLSASSTHSRNNGNSSVNIKPIMPQRVGKIPSKSPDYNRHRQRSNMATNHDVDDIVGYENMSSSTTAISNAKPASSATSRLNSPLPKNLHVLLVESDEVLRKMIKKLLKSVEPTWKIREAPDGETAIRLSATNLPPVFPQTDRETTTVSSAANTIDHVKESQRPFDLILIDEYLSSSADRKLLGTETIPKLREAGITCCICGLSAQILKDEFIKAGANSFLPKPVPSNKYILIDTLAGIIKKKRSRRASM